MIGTAATAPQSVAPSDDEICRLPASELVRLLRAREFSAIELLNRVLARADEVADSVNPFSVRLDDAARAAARDADRLLQRGEGGPLTGLPVSVKDSQWLAGVESSYGSRARLGFVPQETLGAVERLVSAGAVVFAKTNVSEFCYFGISEAPVFGRTNNPHDLTRTARGSSGGAAAQVATYAGPVGLGGDGGGSIRILAAFCGVVGFKPTFGLVPHEPSAAGWKTLVSVGPLARADTRLLLEAIAGRDRRDRHCVPWPELPPDEAGRRLRVVASEDLGFAPVDEDVRRAFRGVVAGLSRAGVDVVADNPGLSSSAAIWATTACAEARWSEAAEYERRASLLSPEVRDYLAFGERISTEAYIRAQFERDRIHRAYADLFARTGADVLLTPTVGGEAFTHGRRYPEAIGGVPIEPPWLDWSGFLYDANLAGLPACAIPSGIGDDHLPVSVQIIGERWQDRLVLGAAEAIESVLAVAPPTGPAAWERQKT